MLVYYWIEKWEFSFIIKAELFLNKVDLRRWVHPSYFAPAAKWSESCLLPAFYGLVPAYESQELFQ